MWDFHVSFPHSWQRVEVSEARQETERLRESLEEGEGQRERDMQETVGLHKRLADREVGLCFPYLATFDLQLSQTALGGERRHREELAAQLAELTAAHNSLRSKVTELEEGNAVLQRENDRAAQCSPPSWWSVLQVSGSLSYRTKSDTHFHSSTEDLPPPPPPPPSATPSESI